MSTHNIEAVVLYTTNDHRFFKACIQNLLACDIKTHVVTYTKMWNGDDENLELQEKSHELFKDNPNYVQYQIEWHPGEEKQYWESLGRYLVTKELPDSCEYVLYIDIDEIVDVEKCKAFMKKGEYKKYDAVWLHNYWYFREPIYRAKTLESTTIMCKTSLAKSIELKPTGRNIYSEFNNVVVMCKEDPFVHHYSWVRTKTEMLNKARNWGHRGERNWEAMIEEEFNHPFSGKDFIHRYQYDIVENQFGIDMN